MQMMVRTLVFCLGLVSIPWALPLREGDVWVYSRPKNHWRLGEFWTTSSLHVLDSTRQVNGVLWRLVLRDEGIAGDPGQETELQMLQTSTGTQSWALNPPLGRNDWPAIPWNPSPENGVPVPDLHWPWPYPRIPYLGIWEDSLGWIWKERWVLRSHNAREIQRPWKLHLPEVGSSWTWKTTHHDGGGPGGAGCTSIQRFDTSRTTTEWEITRRLEDSSGWIGLEIRQTRRPGGDSVFELRLDPDRRRRLAPIWAVPYDESWWEAPTKGRFQRGGITFQIGFSSLTSFQGMSLGFGESASSFAVIVDPSGTLDSLGETQWSSYPTSKSFRTCKMVVSETVRIRADGSTARVPKDLMSVHEGLRGMSAKYPMATIRWRDLQGRGGSFRGWELESFLDRRPRELIVLDARLPDGTRWSGKVQGLGGKP